MSIGGLMKILETIPDTEIFEDGKETEESVGYYENCSKEAYSCYELCWGEMSKCYHKDENGNWVQHDCKGCTGCSLGTA